MKKNLSLFLCFVMLLNFALPLYKAASASELLAPINVKATEYSPTNIKLTWDAVSGAGSYKIYQLNGSEKTFLSESSSNAGYVNTLNEGNYEFAVSAISGPTESILSVPVSVNIIYPVMETPKNLTHTIKNGNEVQLRWEPSPNVAGYKIFQTFNGERKLLTKTTSLTYYARSLVEGKYTFEVLAYHDRFGESLAAKAETEIINPVMQPPADLTLSLRNGNDVVLKWTASEFADNYNIYRITENERVKVASIDSTYTSKTFYKQPEGYYKYEVTASSDRFGESINASMVEHNLVYSEMQPPEILTAAIKNGNDLYLKWNESQYASSYNIYKLVNNERIFLKNSKNTNVTLFNMPEEYYEIEITAVSDRFGESASASYTELNLIHPDMTAPANVKLDVRMGNDIALTWDESAFADSYNVYQIQDGKRTLIKNIIGLSYTHRNLPEGNYSFEITSFSSRFGESSGTSVEYDLVHPIMQPPTEATYKILNGNDIILSWTEASYVSKYNIYQLENGERKLIGSTSNNNTTKYTLPNLPEGKLSFEVTSFSDRFGESKQAMPFEYNMVHPEMKAPTNLKASIINGNEIALYWDTAEFANSYSIYQTVNGERKHVATTVNPSYRLKNQPEGTHGFEVFAHSDRFGPSETAGQTQIKLKYPIMQPPVLKLAPLNTDSISLTWKSVQFASTYNIYKVENGKNVFVKNTNLFTETINKLPNGSHEYVVTAISPLFGESEISNKVTFEVELGAPNVIAEVKELQVTLNWSEVTGAASYNVYVMKDGSEKYLGTVETGTSYIMEDVEPGVYEYHLYAVSGIGTKSKVYGKAEAEVIEPDQTAPITRSNLDEGWYRYDIYGKLTASDDRSGVDKTFYSINSGEMAEGRAFTITEEGSHTVSFYSIDKKGNVEEVKTETVKLDKKAPVSEINTNLALPEITATDELSGLAKTYFSINGGELTEGNILPALSEGSYEIEYFSTDKAGNVEATKTLTFIVDQQAPETLSNITEKWSKKDFKVQLTATDDLSGVASTFYSINGSEFTEGTSFSVEEEGVHEVSFYSVDKAGNVEEVKTATVKLDITAPVSEINTDLAQPEITAIDELSGLDKTYFSINGGDLTEGNILPALPEGSYEISYYSIDKAGNQEEAKTISYMVDETAPVTTSNLTEDWNTASFGVQLTATDDLSGVASTFYSLNGSEFAEGTSFTVEEEGIHEVAYYSVDKAGNKEELKTEKLFIDFTAPVTTAITPEGWTNSEYTMELYPTDNLSGVDKTYYSINDSEFVEGTSIEFIEEGVFKVSFYSVDKAGNVEDIQTIELNYDKTAPVTVSDAPSEWKNSDVQVNLTATDNLSGVAATYYSLKDGDFAEGQTIDLTEEGIHTLSFYSTDKAGNVEEAKTSEVKIDRTAPVTEAIVPEEWTNADVAVELKTTDNLSGVAKTYYAVNGSEFAEGTSLQLSEEGVHEISFYSVDNAGNVEQVKTVAVNLDKTAPVTTSNIPNEWVTEDFALKLTATDNLSGVDKTFYSLNGSEFAEGNEKLVTEEGVHQVSFYSTDKAGNIEEAKKSELKIDKTLPEITADFKDLYAVGEVFKLNYEATDKVSGLAYESIKVNGKEYKKGQCFMFLFPGNYTIEITATDNAGLTQTYTKKITVYIPACMEVTPKVINSNKGTFTVRVPLLAKFDYDESTVTMNGVAPVLDSKGKHKQSEKGQFKFNREDFVWDEATEQLVLKAYVGEYLVIAKTDVSVRIK
ncbi:OmpL47-type beta-barrel domain-containing protein [Fictibacillus aquaticus]|uniref:Fibronectin type-III domain-containing protein n=1 Tax=Fictibacillus aquaticus TaxID=2021314 RepID=A0A235FF05_9BACL|nr:Ig-like domain repeat protein [Fictibacillus aquaticus]OYD59739.1 hypothetical protein CGZ90_07620 [Fictibacillus aquaticus]